MAEPEVQNRRELATRAQAWPRALARGIARLGVTPNMVSVASMFFAVLAWWSWYQVRWDDRAWWFIIPAAAIQLRLLCNLLDGLLAIEGGLKSKTGELYNEVPDRIADVLILAGAGHGVIGLPLGLTFGWACAVVAVLTAYVRLLGGSLGFRQEFLGPMAKQHRMFVLTVGTIAAAFERGMGGPGWSLWIALAVILAGSIVTFARRLSRIAKQLEAR